jgi:hypothetical protein
MKTKPKFDFIIRTASVILAISIFAVSLLSTNPASAETSVDTMVRRYDDGETQVTSPHLRVKSTVANDSVEIGAGYAMDIVTSSSTDVRSWSSTGRITDIRKEYSADLGMNLERGSVTGGWVHSAENDYDSNTFSLGTTRDFFEKNTTLDLGVSAGFDHVRNSHDPLFNAPMNSEMISMGLTQVLSPVSIAQLLYDFRDENGFLAGSYRVARLFQPDGTVFGIPENVPDNRVRNSVAIKYNYFIRRWLVSTATTLRYYFDTWGVGSETAEERISRDLNKKWSMTLNLRYYTQTASNFYQDKYDPANLTTFFTGNKTLSNYYSILAGIRPTYHFHQNWEAYGKMEYYIEHFNNFTDVGNPLDANDDKLYALKALIIGAGISGKF